MENFVFSAVSLQKNRYLGYDYDDYYCHIKLNRFFKSAFRLGWFLLKNTRKLITVARKTEKVVNTVHILWRTYICFEILKHAQYVTCVCTCIEKVT